MSKKTDSIDFESLDKKLNVIGKRLKEVSIIQSEIAKSIIPQDISNSVRGEQKTKNQLQKLKKIQNISEIVTKRVQTMEQYFLENDMNMVTVGLFDSKISSKMPSPGR